MDPLGSLVPWVAAYGVAALIGATFLERVIPILPSYLLLVVIGIAAAQGHFSLLLAMTLSTLGSVLGCLPAYAIGAAFGESRSRNAFERSARFIGVSSDRFGRWLDRFRANERSIALGAQIVPTVRLIAPGISGLLRAQFWPFLGATALGAALWNAVFIGAGYGAASMSGDTNASAVAIKTFVALIAAEGLLLVVWRLGARRRPSQQRSYSNYEAQGAMRGDFMPFLRAWLAAPLRVAAVAPSSASLADLMTSEINAASSPVIELGAGTGSFTRALIKRGVPEDGLVIVESNAEFAGLLTQRFPRARILAMDATRFGDAEMSAAGAAISGLPLLSMPHRQVVAILEATFDRLRPESALYQFTYGPRCPISRKVLDELDLEATRIGGTFANIPPASVYRIARRPSLSG